MNGAAHREPRVGLAFGSSPFSVLGLCASASSSWRERLLRPSPVMLLEDAGRLPLALELKEMVSLGGVPMVSEP